MHHVIIMSDTERPIYQVWVDRSMTYFTLGYARLAKVILKGTLVSESHSFNKTSIRNAVERTLACNQLKWNIHSRCVSFSFLWMYVCICVFACPEQSSQCLFLTCDYFCPPFRSRCCQLFNFSGDWQEAFFPPPNSLALCPGHGLAG